MNGFEWTDLKESKYNPCKCNFQLNQFRQIHKPLYVLVLCEQRFFPFDKQIQLYKQPEIILTSIRDQSLAAFNSTSTVSKPDETRLQLQLRIIQEANKYDKSSQFLANANSDVDRIIAILSMKLIDTEDQITIQFERTSNKIRNAYSQSISGQSIYEDPCTEISMCERIPNPIELYSCTN